ncbi:MAG: 5'-nucleotidase, lipoprotein e(P4) family [Bacteroidales bacterium]|nr:5'-nucleotidase, lipoprotein e(P4) family [Bacteroidales bacterium]MCF8456679.1 5'-nucleotidase, lipoprotein e(P4) family [Bacteroidales bacterium]
MKRSLIILLVISIAFTACKRVPKNTGEKLPPSQQTKLDKNSAQQLVVATLWFQKSAERRALSYQAFNWAEKMLVSHLDNKQDDLPPCVVLDIDETVLDNSPFEGKYIETGKPYSSESWKEWSDLAQATAIPGALRFCNFSMEQGVEVFYVSNRRANELEGTRKNLSDLGFPNSDDNHILLRTDESSKKSRRSKIAESHSILLLLGDNLDDFSELFENRQIDLGYGLVDQEREKFGNRFILLPNPMYGSWESAALKNETDETLSKAKKRLKQIQSY